MVFKPCIIAIMFQLFKGHVKVDGLPPIMVSSNQSSVISIDPHRRIDASCISVIALQGQTFSLE